jgi:hypothetical protein
MPVVDTLCVAVCLIVRFEYMLSLDCGCGGRPGGYSELVPDCRVCFEFLLYEPGVALRHWNNS